MKLLVLGLALISSLANAARLEGVSILEIKPEEGNIKIKIQAKDGPKDSYFFVDISKGDPEAFEKLVKAIKKAKHKNQYQLDLSILSFSLSPNGSYYKSEGVTFDLKGDREPDSIKSKKKDKK